MTRFRHIGFATLGLGFLVAQGLAAQQAPDPQEVYELIRKNLPSLTDAQLQTAAVEGLVKELQPRVWLTGSEPGTNAGGGPMLTKSAVYDGPVAYFRIGRVGSGLAQDLQSAYADLTRTQALKGLVLDLRFADGADYAAAGAVADLFVAKQQPLLDWGAGSARSTEKTNALRLPVAVLVNKQTTAAAEALAAALRDVGAALVLGTNTAGRATIADEFPLKNGQRLCVARTGVKLGSGTALTVHGVNPDIHVAVSSTDEKTYWADPFKDLNPVTNLVASTAASGTNALAGATNRPPRRRLNEAELVRERRQAETNAMEVETREGARSLEPEVPLVRDPVLARALDLIKGIALVKQLRAQ